MQNNTTSITGDETSVGDQISEAVAESYVSIPTLDNLEHALLTESFSSTAHNTVGINDCEINKAFTRRNVGVFGASAAVDSDESIDEESRCAVCFLQMVLPVQLPCNHIFCFLCVKGVALTNSPRCALCRQPIPADFLLRPTLVQLPGGRRHDVASASHGSGSRCAEGGSLFKEPEGGSSEGPRCADPSSKCRDVVENSPLKIPQPRRGVSPSSRPAEGEESLEDAAAAVTISAEEELLDYHWFYEGRNGWWRYDQRTSEEIESFYQKKDSTCQVMVAGLLFVVDFSRMLQYRSKDPTKRRKIKRDVSSIPIKGVAGISLRRLDGGEEETGEELSTDAATAVRLAGNTEIARVDHDTAPRPRRFLTRDNDHNYAEGDRSHLARDTDHNYADGERRLLTRDIDHNYAEGGRRFALRDTDHNYADGERRHFPRDSDHNYADGDRRYLARDADHNYAHSDTLHNTSLESVRDTSVRSRSTSYINVQEHLRNPSVNCCISHPFSNNEEHAGISSSVSGSTRSLDQRSLHQPRREGIYHRRGHQIHEGLLDDPSRSSDDSGRFDQAHDVSGPPSINHCGDCNRPRCMAPPANPAILQTGPMCAGSFDLLPCLHIHACHNCHPSSSHCLCCHRVCSGCCSTSSNVTVSSDDEAAGAAATAAGSAPTGEQSCDANCQGVCCGAPARRGATPLDKALNCSCNSRQAVSCDPCQCQPPNSAYRPDALYDESPEYYHIDLDIEDDFESGGVHATLIENPSRSVSHQTCVPPDSGDEACTVELTCYSEVQAPAGKDEGAASSVSVERLHQELDLAAAAAGCLGISNTQGSLDEVRSRGLTLADSGPSLSGASSETRDDAFGATTR